MLAVLEIGSTCGTIVAAGDLILTVNTLTVDSGAMIGAFDFTQSQGIDPPPLSVLVGEVQVQVEPAIMHLVVQAGGRVGMAVHLTV